MDIYKQPKKGYTFFYKYEVNGAALESHEWVGRDINVNDYSVGDSIAIFYACDEPQISKVKPKKN